MDFKAQKTCKNEECVFNAHENRHREGGSGEGSFKAEVDVLQPKPKIPSPRVPFVLSGAPAPWGTDFVFFQPSDII